MDDPARYSVLDDCLMPARMAPYLRACDGDRERARRLYVWNIEISAAFWGPINGVEVAIRNAVHGVLAEHFDRADWWNTRGLDARAVSTARDEEDKLAARLPKVTADDVVAALSFGFWSSMLGGPKGALEQNLYWQRCLHRAFPGWTHQPNDARGRKAFLRRIELLRKFRNRVAHHEPIHARDLRKDHDRILDVAALIHPDLASFLRGHSRVPDVLARRTAAVEDGVCQF